LPLVAGDAHVRFHGSATNNWGNYQHTKRLTRYTADPAELVDVEWLRHASMSPSDVTHVNFRMIFENDVESVPAVTPDVDTFWLTYRIAPGIR